MVERLAHRELRNRSAEVLRDVAGGATYEITNHGVVVALLSPATTGPTMRSRAAKIHRGFSSLVPVLRDESTTEVLDELRGDR